MPRSGPVRLLRALLALAVLLLAMAPALGAPARAASSLADRMPDVAALGRTQTMRVAAEGALAFDEVAARLADQPDAAGTLEAWGWTDGYERTFDSADALPNDAFLVQVTYQRFAEPVTPEMLAWFAGARIAGTALAVLPPHAQHPDWVKLGGPTVGGNEITYYAAAGDVLARVLTVAAGDPAADATDIMGRVLRLLDGGRRDGAGARPSRDTPADPRPATADADEETGDAGARPAPAPTAGGATADGADAAAAAFVAVDAFWEDLASGGWYASPGMETFVAPADSGCGAVTEEQGPFYCPLDQTVYLNLPMVELLADEEFALGLIVAHEWGHHVQQLAGFEKSAFPNAAGEVYSVELELAADCFAGVWAAGEVNAGRATLEQLLGALEFVAALGDAAGSPLTDPDAHGSGEMRADALALGATTGDPRACAERYLS